MTASSMAALPALIAGARAHMGLAASATEFVLPLSVSLFRIGTVMANPIKLLFLAHVYGVALRPEIIAMFIATELTNYSLPHIAREFGKKDHTTVMYARNKIKDHMQRDEAYRNRVRQLIAMCQTA